MLVRGDVLPGKKPWETQYRLPQEIVFLLHAMVQSKNSRSCVPITADEPDMVMSMPSIVCSESGSREIITDIQAENPPPYP